MTLVLAVDNTSPARAYLARAVGVLPANSVRALRADLAVFEQWGGTVPAESADVARFVVAIAPGRARATVRRYIASLAHLHKALGLPDPTTAREVKWAFKKVVRSTSGVQRQAAPLSRPEVEAILCTLSEDPRDVRDAALVSVMYDGALRRSEVVSLLWEDLSPAEPNGSRTLALRRSKTDQEAAGAILYLPPDTAARLARWAESQGLPEGGPIFCLSESAVARLLKRRAEAAGIDATRVSGHSLRVGVTNDMVRSGLSLPAIMQANRWKSPDMVAHYAARLLASDGAAAQLAKAQGRMG